MADINSTEEFNRVVSGGSFTIENAENQTQGNNNANTENNTKTTQENTDNTQENATNNTANTNDNKTSSSTNSTDNTGNGSTNADTSKGNTNTTTKSKNTTNTTTNIQSSESKDTGNAAKDTTGNNANAGNDATTDTKNTATGNTTQGNTESNTANTTGNATNNTTTNTDKDNTTTQDSNQNQIITTQDNTLQEKIDNDMQAIDTQLTLEANAKKQQAALNNQTTPPNQLTQADKDRIEATYKQAQDALAKNANFIIKVDLSLRAIIEQIAIMRILNDYYVFHAGLLKDNKDSIANAMIDIESANKRFKLMVEMANKYIQEAIKQMDNANIISLELRKELEILHDSTQKDLLETQENLKMVKVTFEKLQKLETQMGNLDKALQEAELIVEKHAKILQDMKDFINVEMTKAQAELMLKKEEYERDLQATRDLFLQKFNELMRNLESKGLELETQANTIRFDTINEINTIANNRLNELKKIDVELGANIQATKDNAIADIQSKYAESLDKLKDEVNILSNDINTLKTNSLQELETKKTDSITEITNAKDSTLKEMQTLKDTTLQETEAKREQIENLAQDSITNIESKKTDSINEIDTKLQDFNALVGNTNTNIDSKLKEYNANAQAKTNEFNTNADTKKAQIDSKTQDSFTIIQNKGDEINNILESKIQTIDKNSEQALKDIESKRSEALQNMQTQLTDSTNQIDTKKQEALKELDKHRDDNNKQAESNANELEAKQNQFLKEVSEVQTDYLTEIQGSNFASLKDFIVNLLNPPNVYEKELIQVSFTANTSWTPPTGLKNIYVTLRGGTGATNANTNGAFSSFGAYITAQGGAGNVNGAGQFGESKFMFIDLKDYKPINIVVGSGGYVNVAYNNLEIFDIKLYDTSFITQSDIPYLPKGNATILKDEYIKTINDVTELSALKNIIEIRIDTSDFSDDDITKLSTKGLNIKDRRSLELYITRQLVESKMVTEASKRHLKYILANYKNATTTTKNPTKDSTKDTTKDTAQNAKDATKDTTQSTTTTQTKP